MFAEVVSCRKYDDGGCERTARGDFYRARYQDLYRVGFTMGLLWDFYRGRYSLP